MLVHLRLSGGGGDGDQPDRTERGAVTPYKRRGLEATPDWHADPEKYRAKKEREKLERGELVVAFGPFCAPRQAVRQAIGARRTPQIEAPEGVAADGAAEEAMVCQLDVEAKRRKTEALEAARSRAHRAHRGASGANDERRARRAARQEKLVSVR